MENKLIKNKVIIKIIDKYKKIWSLYHLSSLANWDMDTYMPEEGLEARGEALSKVSSLIQELFLEKEFVLLIKDAEKEKLNGYENAIVRVLNRGLKIYQKLPSEFIEEFAKLTTDGRAAWKKARDEDNFSIFEPYLEKIVEMEKKKAEYLGYKDHPYNALLDEFEEGLTIDEVEKYFSLVKKPLIELLKYIKSSKKFKNYHELEEKKYDIKKMEEFNKEIIKKIHYNLKHIRLDTTVHPFSTMIGKGDSRITTRYSGKDFSDSYSSTIHEYGHSLYDLQCESNLHYTPIAGGSSMIIHESQSRFWENIIGKSKEFISYLKKDIDKIDSEIAKYSVEELYRYFNLVKPSFIRTEADEVTYHLHVIIRFEIEKGLIEGTIKVKDLPKVWNNKYKEYLGVIPKNNKEGVLQDVHWSQGYIGYFPTYSIGTSLSFMWKYYLEKDIGLLNELVKTKDGIKKIQDWLKENIHKYGSTYTFKDLVKKSCKEEFNPKYMLEELEKKYKEIY